MEETCVKSIIKNVEIKKLNTFARPCPICAADTGSSLIKICYETFKNTPFVGTFDLVICGRCGFAFNDFSSRQADFNDYYNDDKFYLTSGTISVGNSIAYEEKRLARFALRLKPFVPNPDSNIIDIGSSWGGLLKLLSEQGFKRLYGVEANPSCVKFIKEKLGFDAAVGLAQLLPFDGKKADVLIYSHVIEHVMDLQALLSVAKEKLSDDGIICVEVPDAKRYQECSTLPLQSLYLEHVNHFSSETLINFFSKGGFKLVTLEQISEKHSDRGCVPCIWAVFRKGRTQETANAKSLENALRDYVDWSNKHPLFEELQKLSEDRTPVYVWGMSYYAMLLLGQSPLRFCTIAGFIDKDQNKQRQKIMSCAIQSPEILSNAAPESMVLITALGYEAPIIRELNEMGYRGKVLKIFENEKP
jgi:2-polyprenyl-3-methyl-5-hydroxy-6-metoxy-1,4-benzoquinol methylase